ncbi:MAG: hypothetical protein LH606_06365 [Cytophagaceae bacterium]|nr:hypothetical protein [Cytophagaceae bacterium]
MSDSAWGIINLRVTYERQKAELSTGLVVGVTNWDAETERVKKEKDLGTLTIFVEGEVYFLFR